MKQKAQILFLVGLFAVTSLHADQVLQGSDQSGIDGTSVTSLYDDENELVQKFSHMTLAEQESVVYRLKEQIFFVREQLNSAESYMIGSQVWYQVSRATEVVTALMGISKALKIFVINPPKGWGYLKAVRAGLSEGKKQIALISLGLIGASVIGFLTDNLFKVNAAEKHDLEHALRILEDRLDRFNFALSKIREK